MMIKIVCICIVSVFVVLILKNILPSYSPLLSMSAGIVVMGMIAPKLLSVINSLEKILIKHNEVRSYFSIVIKVVLISLICEFSSQLCSDHGQNYLASKIEFSGKISILFLAMPKLIDLITRITDIVIDI